MKKPADANTSKDANDQGAHQGRMAPFGDRTFLGGGRVSTRLRLFTFFCVLTFAAAGGIYYYVNKMLEVAGQKSAEAAAIVHLVNVIEQKTWQLRSTERDFILSGDPQHIAVYDSITKSINAALGSLDSYPAARSIKEHIATISDGISQHTTAFHLLGESKATKQSEQAKKLLEKVNNSSKLLASRLRKTNIASLTNTFKTMRGHEKRFLQLGTPQELIQHKKKHDEFKRLLASAPLSKGDIKIINQLMTSYQADLTALAKAKLSKTSRAGRLNEIFSYLLPSLSGITDFAKRNSILVQEQTRKTHQMVRTAALAGGSGLLIVLGILGLILLSSLASPIHALAKAADKLVAGDRQTTLPAMGNHDEIGEVARALSIFKETLGEAGQLQKELQMTRHALETAQRDAQAARDELEMQLQSQAQIPETAAEPPPEPAPTLMPEEPPAEPEPQPTETPQPAIQQQAAPEAPPTQGTAVVPAPSDSIATLSEQLAQSSQTVSAAAFEAERTSTLIRGLTDAEAKLQRLDPLIRIIGKQTNFLAFPKGAEKSGRSADTHRNLVVLSSEKESSKTQLGIGEEDIKKRFETIRKAAVQIMRNVRDVTQTVTDTKGVALDLAASSSADALEITTDLLEQSENLRGMLNDLIGTLHGTALTPPTPNKPASGNPQGRPKPPTQKS